LINKENLLSRLLYIAFLICCLAAAGCTPAQQEEITIKSTVKSATKQYDMCSAPIMADPTYGPLKAHVPFTGFLNASIEQMESPDYPTSSDIKLGTALEDRLNPCRENLITALDSIPGSLGAPIENYYNDEEQGVIVLSQGRITWGQFVQAMHNAAIDQQEQLMAAINQLGSQLQAENDVEAAQQAQAYQNFADYLQRQQAINAANRPIITNCNHSGNQTNCTSY